MRRILPVLFLILATAIAHSQTNTLILTWMQPPGYDSTLYYATNLNGTWSEISTDAPPYTTQQTNPISFFYVNVAPIQIIPVNVFGGDEGPTNLDLPVGSMFVGTNYFQIWIRRTNGWYEGVGP